MSVQDVEKIRFRNFKFTNDHFKCLITSQSQAFKDKYAKYRE
ncbi:hypothetical protein MIDIC_240026 [Alphaproteobacteria bacterium]